VYCLSKTFLTTNKLRQWHVSVSVYVHAFRTYMVSDASIQTRAHIRCKLFTNSVTDYACGHRDVRCVACLYTPPPNRRSCEKIIIITIIMSIYIYIYIYICIRMETVLTRVRRTTVRMSCRERIAFEKFESP